jgi:hypothetical protein
MKILVYISSLLLSGYTYLLFATYLTASAGMNSVLPLISFYSAMIIFGFLSWFHFYKPKPGAILLTIFIVIMFFSFPIFLLVGHFTGEYYKPAILEGGIPLLLSIITIIFIWKAIPKKDLNRYLKVCLATVPLIFGLYACIYFTVRAFF